jgi:hypothetical protein
MAMLRRTLGTHGLIGPCSCVDTRFGHVHKTSAEQLAAPFNARTSMMLKRCSAFVLFSVLLPTAANAQCKDAGEQLQSAWQQLQAAQTANYEAATEYSTCVQDRGRENCQGEYSQLQSTQDDLKTAVSGYANNRRSAFESGCTEQSERPFGKVAPLGVWPPPPK